MRFMKRILVLSGITALVLIVAGCLWSGTFVVNQTIKFDSGEDFYSYRVDLTTSSTWRDHKDDIHQIEMVGFVLYFSSYEQNNVAFSAYVDEAAGDAPDPSSVPSTAKLVLDGLIIAPGEDQVITYSQSLAAIKNLDTLKKLVKSGKFDFYGESTGSDGVNFLVDSVTVVVTFSAG